MLQKDEKISDVGVIVGRFHVHKLHEGHKQFIDSIIATHKRVIIFLGIAPVPGGLLNPLDFEARQLMFKETYPFEQYPNITILPIKDFKYDLTWSKELDSAISNVIGVNQTVTLYGSRDSFVKHYMGRYPTVTLKDEISISGSQIREELSKATIASSDFRAGMIYASTLGYKKCICTVDIAIFNEDKTRILLGRKLWEKEYRFVGGFVDPGESFETAARREVMEETGLEVEVKYFKSFPIKDWRYRGCDKITTSLFIGTKIFGAENPSDDICELKWFDFSENTANLMVENHIEMYKELLKEIINW